MFGLWKQLQYSRKPVTTNQSEGMNTVIKNLNGWREAPMDSRIRVLYNKFQGMYIRIIKSRYTSPGDYTLNTQFKKSLQERRSSKFVLRCSSIRRNSESLQRTC